MNTWLSKQSEIFLAIFLGFALYCIFPVLSVIPPVKPPAKNDLASILRTYDAMYLHCLAEYKKNPDPKNSLWFIDRYFVNGILETTNWQIAIRKYDATQLSDLKDEIFLNLHCGIWMAKHPDFQDKTLLAIIGYTQYIVLYFFNAFIFHTLKPAPNVGTNPVPIEEKKELYDDDVMKLIVYLSIFARKGPDAVVFDRLYDQSDRFGLDIEFVYEAKTCMWRFRIQDYENYICCNSFERFMDKLFDHKGDPKMNDDYINYLNSFFGYVLPGCYVPKRRNSDFTIDFEILRRIKALNLWSMEIGENENRITKFVKLMVQAAENQTGASSSEIVAAD